MMHGPIYIRLLVLIAVINCVAEREHIDKEDLITGRRAV